MSVMVNCVKLNKSIRINQDESLINRFRSQEIPIASSCNGEGICKWCKIIVLKGHENLNPLTEFEIKANLLKNERLACQLKLSGNIHITTRYW